MGTYIVNFTRMGAGTLKVEASSPEEAKAKAKALLTQDLRTGEDVSISTPLAIDELFQVPD